MARLQWTSPVRYPIILLYDSSATVHLAEQDVSTKQLKHVLTRMGYLQELIDSHLTILSHIGNAGMVADIGTKVLGREPSETEAPVILDRYANTSSAGSVIAFHLHHEDLAPGDVGLLCSFGAGYSAGTVFLRKR